MICTHNRALSVRRTLESLHKCIIPGVHIECIVVANACTDNTVELVSKFGDKIQLQFRLVQERRVGLAHARNTGYNIARGDWVIFLDDDMTVSPRFLLAYQEAAGKNPGAIAMGGRIEAVWPRSKPWWYPDPASRPVDGVVGTFSPAAHSGYLDQLPFGGNMALKKSSLDYIEFDVSSGMSGAAMGFAEESLLLRQILGPDGKPFYVSDAVAFHHLQAQFLRFGYVYRRLVELNKTLVRLGFMKPRPATDATVPKRMSAGLIWLARVIKRIVKGGDLEPVFTAIEQRARRQAYREMQVAD